MSPEAEMLILRTEGAIAWIKSGERRYRVDPNRLHCNCPGAAAHRICRHLRFLVDRLEGR